MAAPSWAGSMLGTMQVVGFGMVLVVGSFATNAGVTPVATSNKGKGWSVVWSSTGTWTLTFTQSAISILSSWVTGQNHAANVDISLQLGDTDVVTALTAIIRNNPGGSVADLTAQANNRVHFGFLMATSGLNS